jgi:hypothetical protein
MTHTTDSRAIGNHAAMGQPPAGAPRKPMTVTEIVRAGILRRAAAAGADGSPETPTRVGR